MQGLQTPAHIEQVNQNGNLRKPVLLIVDENRTVREMVLECLSQDWGCMVAANAGEAKAVLQAVDCNLVIADLGFPAASGFELCDHIQRHYPRTAVIVVASVDDQTLRLEAWRHGVFGFLAKPFVLQRLEIMATLALLYGGKRTDQFSRFLKSRAKEVSQVSLKS